MAPWAPDWHYDKFESFRDRLEKVKQACQVSDSKLLQTCPSSLAYSYAAQHSKSIVNGLMSGNFVQRLAAAPTSEYKVSC
jgi:hypothetical protein